MVLATRPTIARAIAPTLSARPSASSTRQTARLSPLRSSSPARPVCLSSFTSGSICLPSAGAERPSWGQSVTPRAVRRGVCAMAEGQKSVLVPVADGCEEMEAVIVIDVLVRAGAAVTVASVDGQTVTCSRGVKLVADKLIGEVAGETFDLIAVPGGMPGAEHFRDCDTLISMIKQQKEAGRLYAAICASPAVVFEHHGIITGKPATSHPAFQNRLSDQGSVSQRVVEVDNLTTSQGPGTAFEFALTLVKRLFGPEKMKEIAGPLCMYPTEVLN